MALHKKGKKPPSPDPGSYTWIATKEGGYWRKKRGTTKAATLNQSFKQGSSRMKLSAPAASRIVQKLRPYLKGLQPGRLTTRISGELRKGLKEADGVSLVSLKSIDLQPEYPFGDLLQAEVNIEQTAHELILAIPIAEHTIRRLNNLVTNYYFELVLLYGDANKEYGLRIESEDSETYEIEKDYPADCKLRAVLPEQPWIALLKVNCIEGNELAGSPKLYGMKVVEGGGN
jgi:hypothetical protein